MSVTFENVINNFIAGVLDTEDGSVSTTKTLKIQGDQLIHYWTPIAERRDGKIIVNISRYSLATGKLQKQLKELVPQEQYVTVKGVREGYKGSLTDFLPKEKEV
jgi:hypothetical protein